MKRTIRNQKINWLTTLALAFATCLLAMPAHADKTPLTGIDHYTVVLAKKAITVSGEEIDDAVIVVLDGKIDNIGKNLEYPKNAKVIDARDQVVMPGLINPASRGNLPTFSRSGVHANLVAADELYPTEELFRRQLEAGFTTIGLLPSGSGFPGQISAVHTAGPDDDLVIKRSSLIYTSNRKAAIRSALEKAQKEIDKVDAARKKWEEAQKKKKEAEAKKKKQDDKPVPKPDPQPTPGPEPRPQPSPTSADYASVPAPPRPPTPTPPPASQPAAKPKKEEFKPPKIAPAYQPLVDLIKEKEGTTLLIRMVNASDYIHLLDVFEKYDIAHALFLQTFGTTNVYEIADKLGENEEKILLRAFWNTAPYTADRFLLASQLANAGCEVSLQPDNDGDYAHRNFLARLSELVALGFDRATALKAITLHPAKLLGIDNEYGTIEKERVADLIMLSDDPFAPGTQVMAVMIKGEVVWERKDQAE